MMRVVAATGNSHKLEELSALFASLGAVVVSKRDAGIMSPDPNETGGSFEENALIKARDVFESCGEATVADDSGLAVDALGGLPGIYSARFCEMFAQGSGLGQDAQTLAAHGISEAMAEIARREMSLCGIPQGDRSSDSYNRLLLALMRDIPYEKRTARFVCAIAYIKKGEEPLLLRGVCEGHIAEKASGTGGFGYDPVFVPDECAADGTTFAMLPAEEKNRISHRAHALAQLGEALQSSAV